MVELVDDNIVEFVQFRVVEDPPPG